MGQFIVNFKTKKDLINSNLRVNAQNKTINVIRKAKHQVKAN